MAKVRYIGMHDEVEVPALGQGVILKKGETVEVDDSELDGLLCQEENWAPADSAARKWKPSASENDEAVPTDSTDAGDGDDT